MLRNVVGPLLAGGALLACAAKAGAQPPPPPSEMSTLSFIGPKIPLAPRVEGAPFSAEASTQITQTLGDGTRIEQTTTGKLFRDGAGRVRREMRVLGLGVLDPSAEGQSVITIVDPVAGVRYVLDPRTKEARRVVTSAGFEARQSRAEATRRGSALPRRPLRLHRRRASPCRRRGLEARRDRRCRWARNSSWVSRQRVPEEQKRFHRGESGTIDRSRSPTSDGSQRS